MIHIRRISNWKKRLAQGLSKEMFSIKKMFLFFLFAVFPLLLSFAADNHGKTDSIVTEAENRGSGVYRGSLKISDEGEWSVIVNISTPSEDAAAEFSVTAEKRTASLAYFIIGGSLITLLSGALIIKRLRRKRQAAN